MIQLFIVPTYPTNRARTPKLEPNPIHPNPFEPQIKPKKRPSLAKFHGPINKKCANNAHINILSSLKEESKPVQNTISHRKPSFHSAVGLAVAVVEVEVGSLQPHHPGVLQVVEEELRLEDSDDEVLVLVTGAVEDVVVTTGAALGDVMVVVKVMVVGSLHPNQPGVLHEEVVIVLVIVVVGVVEVVSSKQPHQPGVLQVSVRVWEVLELVVEIFVVVVSLLLLS